MIEVGVAAFRRELKSWLDKVREGEEVLITERGEPVAHLTGAHRSSAWDDLVKQGIISPAKSKDRIRATGRKRAKSTGSVSEFVRINRDQSY